MPEQQDDMLGYASIVPLDAFSLAPRRLGGS
jgi:hypothetical protein